jgi:hypothetical protein
MQKFSPENAGKGSFGGQKQGGGAMEPISSRTERTVGENFENPVLDGVFSDGQTLTLFLGMLRDKSEMDFWLSLSRDRVDELLQDAVRQTKPGWSQARLGAEVDRLRDILGQAIFFRLKADMCHRASRDLSATARDLRAIAADPAKIRAFRDGLRGFSAGEACLENLVGHRGSASVLELKDALQAQAKRMESLAAGLHVRDLLGRENPLREMPELSRRVFESLPQESFVREIFPEHLNGYLERREFERDALVYWKAVCAIATMFSGSLGATAGWVGRLARAGNWGMDRRGAGNGFDHATAFSTAAYLSDGARAAAEEPAPTARAAAAPPPPPPPPPDRRIVSRLAAARAANAHRHQHGLARIALGASGGLHPRGDFRSSLQGRRARR